MFLNKIIEDSSISNKIENSISSSHSLKSTNQLKRKTDEEVFTSFLEKENFNFNDAIENSRIVSLKNQYILNLSQINQKNTILDEKSNRLGRFFLAIFIVIISSLLCFMFVKYSIDWVNFYRISLNFISIKKKNLFL